MRHILISPHRPEHSLIIYDSIERSKVHDRLFHGEPFIEYVLWRVRRSLAGALRKKHLPLAREAIYV